MFRKIFEFGYRNSALTGAVAGAITLGIASAVPDLYAYFTTGSASPDFGLYTLRVVGGSLFGIIPGLESKARAARYEKSEQEKQDD